MAGLRRPALLARPAPATLAGTVSRGSRHDRLHRRLGPYALRQARRRDRREPDRPRRRTRRSSTPASAPRRSTRSCSAISTPASRRRTSPPRSCCRRATASASSRRPGSRTPARPARPRCTRRSRRSRRSARRITLVVGVEQMTHAPSPEIGREPPQGLLPRRGRRDAGRLRRRVRQDRRRLFPAPRRPVRRARA